MKNEMPIDVMSGMRRGDPRKGRYATRSITTAVRVETMIATRTMNSSEATKLLSQAPASNNLLLVIMPVIAPTMNTSPWAKLMNPSTP